METRLQALESLNAQNIPQICVGELSGHLLDILGKLLGDCWETCWTLFIHVWVTFGYALNMFDMFGHLSDIYRTLVQHLLDTFRNVFCEMFDTCWTLVGHFQILFDCCLTRAGNLSDTFWILFLHFPDTCWICVCHCSETCWTLIWHLLDMSFAS
jgi:hypothetical protein